MLELLSPDLTAARRRFEAAVDAEVKRLMSGRCG